MLGGNFFGPILIALLFIAPIVIALAIMRWFRRFDEKIRRELESKLNEIQAISTRLEATPLDTTLHRRVLEIIPLCPQASEMAYRSALETVTRSNGSPICKVFALEVGRSHFANLRPNRLITQYDEQSIQNDINTRMG